MDTLILRMSTSHICTSNSQTLYFRPSNDPNMLQLSPAICVLYESAAWLGPRFAENMNDLDQLKSGCQETVCLQKNMDPSFSLGRVCYKDTIKWCQALSEIPMGQMGPLAMIIPQLVLWVGFPCKNDQRNLKPRQTSNDGEIVCLIMVYKSWIKLTYYGIYERVGCSLPITWKKYASNWIFCSKFWGKHVHKNCLLKPTKRPPSGKLTWQWNPPFEDVFPTRKWGFSNAMLVFRDVKWMSLRKIVMILFPLLPMHVPHKRCNLSTLPTRYFPKPWCFGSWDVQPLSFQANMAAMTEN